MKTLILALLFVMPYITIAQTQNKSVYVNADIRGKQCIGGTGFCSGTVLTGSTEKTMATIQKQNYNTVEVILEKQGFTTKEWEELLKTKTFLVDNETVVTIDTKVLEALEIDNRFSTIKPKNYPVVINRDTAFFVVELQ